jgi:hypothetical protein
MVAGEPRYLPHEEAEVQRLIAEGCELQGIVRSYQGKLGAVKERLAAIAAARRGDKATVHLTAEDGRRAKIWWEREFHVDAGRAESARELLGENWGQVFQSRTVYSLARSYRRFIAVAATKVQALVAKSFEIVEHEARVSFEDVGARHG